jgi:subtilisin family serine protease
MASYSNVAGTSPVVQRNFLVVGVDSSAMGGLAGTSFAAPIVSGYAAIVGSKFTTANATAVANQLLNTARTDTVTGYNAAIYGRGEASLTRALAPASIR